MKHILIIFGILFSINMHAQYWDAGILIGVSNYQGDLAPDKVRASVGRSRGAIGLNARYNLTPRFSFKLGANIGRLSADDKDAVGSTRGRDLSFESKLYDLSLTTEVSLFKYDPSDPAAIWVTPYIFGGISLFHFNPQTQYEQRWVDLRDYHTEGQGLPGYPEEYKLTQFAIPFGFGLKINVNEEWTIGVELGARRTFTDYLDDVSGYYPNYIALHEAYGSAAVELSNPNININEELPDFEPYTIQRGASDNDDWYFIGGLTVSYNFLFKGLFSSASNTHHLGCPRFRM